MNPTDLLILMIDHYENASGDRMNRYIDRYAGHLTTQFHMVEEQQVT